LSWFIGARADVLLSFGLDLLVDKNLIVRVIRRCRGFSTDCLLSSICNFNFI